MGTLMCRKETKFDRDETFEDIRGRITTLSTPEPVIREVADVGPSGSEDEVSACQDAAPRIREELLKVHEIKHLQNVMVNWHHDIIDLHHAIFDWHRAFVDEMEENRAATLVKMRMVFKALNVEYILWENILSEDDNNGGTQDKWKCLEAKCCETACTMLQMTIDKNILLDNCQIKKIIYMIRCNTIQGCNKLYISDFISRLLCCSVALFKIHQKIAKGTFKPIKDSLRYETIFSKLQISSTQFIEQLFNKYLKSNIPVEEHFRTSSGHYRTTSADHIQYRTRLNFVTKLLGWYSACCNWKFINSVSYLNTGNINLDCILKFTSIAVQRDFEYCNNIQVEERRVTLFTLDQFITTNKVKENVQPICSEAFIITGHGRLSLQSSFMLLKRAVRNGEQVPAVTDKTGDVDIDIKKLKTKDTSTRKTPHGTMLKKMKTSKPKNVKSTATEDENTEKIQKTAEKKRKGEGGKTEDVAKMKWWVCRSTLNILQFVLYLGLMTRTASASFSCAENQSAELGSRGTIVCNFPDIFHVVYWYDDAGDSSPPLITYFHNTGEESGLCLENESYDVLKDGSLLICNVAVRHERNYTVIMYLTQDFYEEVKVFLKVIASPGNHSVTVQCEKCHEEHYHSVHAGERLSCFLNGTRPPVKIEWVERYPRGDSLTATQEFKITNNSKGTYNSSADVRLETSSDKQLALLACVATYPLSEWRRETQILLDFSQSESFSSVLSNTFYMEIYRRAELQCGESDHIFRIWKRIPLTGEPETIGFRLDNLTKMTKAITGIEISTEGNLVFLSPQIQNEGEYACMYSDGRYDHIQKTSVILLMAPSPPYIQITGCDDTDYSCVFKENITQELTCTVNGVYPKATLEWIAKNRSQLSFNNSITSNKSRGQTYDVSMSVEYQVFDDVMCADEIYIECRLQGPISRIIKAERMAQIIPKNCKMRNGDSSIDTETWPMILIVGCSTFVIISVCVSYGILIFGIRKRHRKGDRSGIL